MAWKRVAGIVAGIAAVGVLGCGAFLASVFAGMPPSQGPRIEGPHGLVGIEDGGAYLWIVPTAHGVVLVDSGFGSPAGGEELARRGLDASAVHTVLITHGHLDHTKGLPLYPHARVIAGPGEAALIRGEIAPRGLLPRLFGRVVGAPPPPPDLEEASDGAILALDGELFQVIHTPGHTDGSTMYLWRQTLFTGDALFGLGDHVDVAPGVFSNDVPQSRASIAGLRTLDFERIADGHGGLTEGARPLVLAFVP